jgi:hypothetical protein
VAIDYSGAGETDLRYHDKIRKSCHTASPDCARCETKTANGHCRYGLRRLEGQSPAQEKLIMDEERNGTQPEDKSVIMSALVAEFNAMRAEILFRATSQATLMQLNITAAGTVAFFALADGTRALTMIIIPILSPILGILWLDHDATILKLGRFIKTDLKPACSAVANFNLPDYERYAEGADALPAPRFAILNFTIAVFATFGFLPLAALVYVISIWKGKLSLAFLILALLAVLLLLAFFIQFARRFGVSPSKWAASRKTSTPA